MIDDRTVSKEKRKENVKNILEKIERKDKEKEDEISKGDNNEWWALCELWSREWLQIPQGCPECGRKVGEKYDLEFGTWTCRCKMN